jgi:hypothetical protein
MKLTPPSDAEIAAVRKVCDTWAPPRPNGPSCSYPKCYHPSCSAEIKAGRKSLKEKVA